MGERSPRKTLLRAALIAAAATGGCAPSTGASGDAADPDAIVAEAGASIDGGPSDAARGDARADVVVRADAGREAGPAGDAGELDAGTCGASVRACLCACGANATCQQGCISNDEDCSFCALDAASMCCPAESTAFFDCLERTMCADQACITAMCGAEFSAFNTCSNRRQMSDPACMNHVRGCLGADYPSIRCP